MITFKTKNL